MYDANTLQLHREWRGAEFDITVENPDRVMKGVREILLDGKKVSRIPVMDKGSVHKVTIIMGTEETVND